MLPCPYKEQTRMELKALHIETERLIIRDLEQRDRESLFRIIWQEDVVRFMRDWSEHNPCPDSLTGYIAWHRTQTDSTDMYQCKRYAVTLKDGGDMIGVVGMGLEDTLGEVELAYMIDQAHRSQGYATECAAAFSDWCLAVSDLKYLILTIDCANAASCRVAEKSGFQLFEKRTPIGHAQPNMVSDSYYYFRKYRQLP